MNKLLIIPFAIAVMTGVYALSAMPTEPAPIMEPTKDPALYVCDQLDTYPLTEEQREKVNANIKETYNVDCP